MRPALYQKSLQKMKMEEYIKHKEMIEKVSLFQCLTNKQKFSLANAIKDVSYGDGEIIFNVGDVATGLFIIS